MSMRYYCKKTGRVLEVTIKPDGVQDQTGDILTNGYEQYNEAGDIILEESIEDFIDWLDEYASGKGEWWDQARQEAEDEDELAAIENAIDRLYVDYDIITDK